MLNKVGLPCPVHRLGADGQRPNAFSAKAAEIEDDAAAGPVTADQADQRPSEDQTAAQEAMKAAAFELSKEIATQILGCGARCVAVMNLANTAMTLFGKPLPADSRAQRCVDCPRCSNCGCARG